MTESTSPSPLSSTDAGLAAVREPDRKAGADDITTDGRTMRRRRNREAVIDALISLIREGDLTPTVAKIADRAEVSHRSIFRYFDDLNDLARTAIDTEFRKTFPMSIIPNPGEGSLQHRIDSIVERTLATFAQTHALGRVARARILDLPEVERGMSNITEFRFEQIKKQFGPELDVMDEADRESIAMAIGTIISFDSYDQQIRTFDRTPNEVARNWRTALLTLLG